MDFAMFILVSIPNANVCLRECNASFHDRVLRDGILPIVASQRKHVAIDKLRATTTYLEQQVPHSITLSAMASKDRE
jgi:hypothetical protein